MAPARPVAMDMVKELEDEFTCYDAARRITRLCLKVENINPTWARKSLEARQIVADYFSTREVQRVWGDEIEMIVKEEKHELDYLGKYDLERLFDLYDLP